MISINLKNQKINIQSLLLVIFLIVYAIVLVYLASEINVSEDEAYTLNTTSHNLKGIILQSYHFENQPPVYFLVLGLWRLLNSGILFTKLFSIFCILLATFFFNKLSCLISGNGSKRWLTILFMLNPFTVWAALEMRLYAFVILLSIIILYNFIQYFLTNKNKYLYTFLIISLLGIYTQYFFTFLVSSLAFSLLMIKGIKPFIRLCIYLVPLVILFLPNLFYISDQIAVQEHHAIDPSPIGRILSIYWGIRDLFLAIDRALVNVWFVRIVLLIGFPLLGISYYLHFQKFNQDITTFLKRINFILLTYLFLIIQFILFVIYIDTGFATKYMAISFPLLMLLFTLFKVFPVFYRRLIYSLLVLYFILILIPTYQNPVKNYDYKSVAGFIKKIERSNEPLLFYRAGISLPFNFYYKGKNDVVPLPNKVRFDTSYLINIKDTLQLKQCIERINKSSVSYLFISDLTEYESTLDMNRKMIDEYLSSTYKITIDTLFLGRSKSSPLRIRRLEKNK